jgi:hypothetical protein
MLDAGSCVLGSPKRLLQTCCQVEKHHQSRPGPAGLHAPSPNIIPSTIHPCKPLLQKVNARSHTLVDVCMQEERGEEEGEPPSPSTTITARSPSPSPSPGPGPGPGPSPSIQVSEGGPAWPEVWSLGHPTTREQGARHRQGGRASADALPASAPATALPPSMDALRGHLAASKEAVLSWRPPRPLARTDTANSSSTMLTLNQLHLHQHQHQQEQAGQQPGHGALALPSRPRSPHRMRCDTPTLSDIVGLDDDLDLLLPAMAEIGQDAFGEEGVAGQRALLGCGPREQHPGLLLGMALPGLAGTHQLGLGLCGRAGHMPVPKLRSGGDGGGGGDCGWLPPPSPDFVSWLSHEEEGEGEGKEEGCGCSSMDADEYQEQPSGGQAEVVSSHLGAAPGNLMCLGTMTRPGSLLLRNERCLMREPACRACAWNQTTSATLAGSAAFVCF